jgi:hypothetical protein
MILILSPEGRLLSNFYVGYIRSIQPGLKCNIEPFILHTGVFVDVGEILKCLQDQLEHAF